MFFLLGVELALIALIVADCPQNSVRWQDNCYSFVSNNLPFAQAELDCKQRGGHLASIHDAFANAFLAQTALQNFGTIQFWIGAHILTEDYTWSWTDHSFYAYNNFIDSTPIYPQNCAVLDPTNAQWVDTFCTDPKAYICKTGSNILTTTSRYPVQRCSVSTTIIPTTVTPTPVMSHQCPPNWKRFGVTDSCYLYRWQPLDYWSAEDWCRQHGGHLASIHSETELKFIRDLEVNTWKWIGLYLANQTTWKWTDGSPVDYFNWEPNNPLYDNSQCVEALYTERNKNIWCTEPREFVCKSPANYIPFKSIFEALTAHEQYYSCPSGWTYFALTQACYYLLPTLNNWNEAQSVCKTYGANLASVHSMDELCFINSISNQYLWIGLYLNDFTWYWADGSPLNFTNWEYNYPSSDVSKTCVISTDVMENIECGNNYFGICKKLAY